MISQFKNKFCYPDATVASKAFSTSHGMHCMVPNNIFILLLILTVLLPSSTLQSQCYPDRHNTSWYDTWTSCSKKASPNPKRDSSHWILYQLGYEYSLGQSHFWNNNTPASLDYGAKKIAIDYSMDGNTWTAWGDVNLRKANGSKYYEGEKGPDLKGLKAQYLLFTILENYGGNCASLSEIKIDITKTSNTTSSTVYRSQVTSDCLSALAYPNPFKNLIGLDITNSCNQSYSYYIEDVMGRKMSPVTTIHQRGLFNTNYNGSHLSNGVYFLVVHSEQGEVRKKIMKIE